MKVLSRTIFALAASGIMLAGSLGLAGTASAQSGEPVTLNWALWDWDATAYYKPLIDAYQSKNPNVKIEYTDLGSTDYQTVLQTQLAGGGSDIDIVAIKDVPGYTNLIRSGLLEDISGFVAEQKIDPAGYNGLIEELTVDGKLHGLPFRSDFWIVYYNKDLFDKAGVEYPTNDMTLEQFDEKARAVTSGFGANKVYGALFHTWRSTVQLPAILDGKHTLVGGEYDFLKPYYERVLKLQEEAAIPSYASLKTSKTHYSGVFYNNTVAMVPMGSWFIGTQITKVKSGESKATSWGIVKFPHPAGVEAGTTAAQVTSLGVSANSKKKEAALDFVKFVSGPEGAAVVASTGTIPALRDEKVIGTIASTDGFPQDENSRAALQTVKGYLEMPVNPNAAKIEVVLNRAHDEIMTNNISIDEGLGIMNTDVKALLN